MLILSIESSCDETAISLVKFTPPQSSPYKGEEELKCEILGNALASQASLHAQYGGVFPMMAKREHQKNIVPLLLEVLNSSPSFEEGDTEGVTHKDSHPALPTGAVHLLALESSSSKGLAFGSLSQTHPLRKREEIQITLSSILAREPELLEIFLDKVITIPKPDIDAIAVTVGPGLEPALWVGINFAKALSYLWGIPVIPVNHMEGHIFSIFPTAEGDFTIPNSKEIFPLISLLVSGGHTELILMKDWSDYTLLGATRDDAAGEAFDKVARMLDLPYPGGPEISRLAAIERERSVPGSLAQAVEPSGSNFQQKIMCADGNTAPSEIAANPSFKFPRPMIHSGDYNFSFSGLKTSVLYTIRDIETKPLSDKTKQAIAKEFEDAAVDVLVHKTLQAVGEYDARTVIVGGGVSANTHLQKVLSDKIHQEYPEVSLHFPLRALSTDNAIMIALAGYFQSKVTPPTSDYTTLIAQGNMAL